MKSMKMTDPVLRKLACLLVASSLSLTGCGVLTDSGADAEVDLQKEDYLAVELLEDASGGNGVSASTYKYQTAVLEKGTFTTEADNVRTEIYVPTEVYETAEVNTTEMLFQSFAVAEDDYVEKGDPLAYVTVNYDDVAIEDAKLTLDRLKTAYANAQTEHDKEIEEERSGPFYLCEDDMNVMKKGWEIEDVTWEQTVASYEKQIEDQTEYLEELEDNASVTSINADCSGYVSNLDRFSENEKLYDGEYICSLVPSDQVYVEVTDTTGSFNYGEKYTFTSESRSGFATEFDAVVVSAPAKALYCNLGGNKAYLKVDTTRLPGGFGWSRSSITGVVKKIENVILVPVEGVTEKNNSTYVTAIKEDGTLETLPFTAGGSNKEYYWVISGIEEGTTILLNN